MYIRHNVAAMNTTRQLTGASKNISKHTERLTTSLKINRAGDDVAGLSISEKMRAQISGLSKASTNTQDSISLIQTAEGALAEANNILIRGRELAVQAANDTNTNDDREKLQMEWEALLKETDRIGTDTEFNTLKLFDGSKQSLVLQIGANEKQHKAIELAQLSTGNLGLDHTSILTQEMANHTVSAIDYAVKFVSEQRSQLGAWQNSLTHNIENVTQTSGNLLSADSVIRNANIAFETMNFTKEEILQDTMQSVMSHSNMKNDWILKLLN